MKRRDTHRKGYKSHAFTPAEDARILELRAQGFNRYRISMSMQIAYYAITARVDVLELLASNPSAKVRICIRPGCTTEFLSREFSHRVCVGCKSIEQGCEPFGNFVVVNA